MDMKRRKKPHVQHDGLKRWWRRIRKNTCHELRKVGKHIKYCDGQQCRYTYKAMNQQALRCDEFQHAEGIYDC